MNEAYRAEDFVCQLCGNCCAIEGTVRVLPREAIAIAAYLGVSLGEFERNYLAKMEDGALGFIDHPETTRCIMLSGDNLCRINDVKPSQCSGFPASWINPDASRYCEGLHR